jgi:hypothetical protein
MDRGIKHHKQAALEDRFKMKPRWCTVMARARPVMIPRQRFGSKASDGEKDLSASELAAPGFIQSSPHRQSGFSNLIDN